MFCNYNKKIGRTKVYQVFYLPTVRTYLTKCQVSKTSN